MAGGVEFIGMRTVERLFERGDEVVGIDDINDDYDARLERFNLFGFDSPWLATKGI
jgi:UDP-glucuronate 4-epimerase